MLLRVPHYYKQFTCIADRCKDSCCIGWEIDIDDNTYAYYQSVDGDLGKRFKEDITEGEQHSFRLKKGRCAFLNDKNLCDICTELGETALCEICTEYPRFTLEYGNVREKCLGLSCEEVGRLVFHSADKITFQESQLEDGYEQDDEDTMEFYRAMESARDAAIAILQRRSLPITERIVRFLMYAEGVQNLLNDEELDDLNDYNEQFAKTETTVEPITPKRRQEYFTRRSKLFRELEVLDKEWNQTITRIKKYFSKEEMSAEDYVEHTKEFMEFYQEREYEYEHLMVYFAFRYLMKSVYDYDFLAKAKLAVASLLVIRDMDVERYERQNKQFTVADRIDNARIYSKEVEHSEENLEYLADAFLFEDVFATDALLAQILL